MGLFSTPIKTLDDLFVHTLQDIYYAEQQIVKNLPEMAQKASNPELKAAFQQHLTESQGHVQRLEQVFQMQGKPVKGVIDPALIDQNVKTSICRHKLALSALWDSRQ
jgi:ferritin-like metal-binding protein YciE